MCIRDRDWLSYPNNRVVAILAGLVVALVIALECVSLYTLISRDAAAMHEIILAPPPQTSGLMSFLSENKGMGVGVALVMCFVNFALAS